MHYSFHKQKPAPVKKKPVDDGNPLYKSEGLSTVFKAMPKNTRGPDIPVDRNAETPLQYDADQRNKMAKPQGVAAVFSAGPNPPFFQSNGATVQKDAKNELAVRKMDMNPV